MRHAKDPTMRRLMTIILTILTTISCFSQDWEKSFRDELYNSLTNQTDSIYILDRQKLEKVSGMTCNNNIVTFSYLTQSKERIEIRIEKGDFEPSKHKIYLFDTISTIANAHEVKNLIDNRYSYGIDRDMPKTEIKNISIKWSGLDISIPDSAFSNLYEPHLCSDYLAVETYIFKNKKLFVYVNASDGAGGYAVKFVFDKEKYLTRIITTNEMTNGYDFLDGTAKYDE